MSSDSVNTGPKPEIPAGPQQSAASNASAEKATKTAEEQALDAFFDVNKPPPTAPNVPFSPCHMFFYGSLMDIDVLQRIARLFTTPVLTPATIAGFKMKMWGQYPTLIAADNGQVKGMVWKCEEEAHFLRLKSYETQAYTWCFCVAELDNGTMVQGTRTFIWAGEPDSEELMDGSFNLAHYQEYYKMV